MARRILILDEDESVLFAYKKVLQRKNFEVVASTTKAQFLNLSDSGNYDVFIVDLKLHEQSVDNDIKLIGSARNSNPGCVIIVIAESISDEFQEKAFLAGARYFFEKPVSTHRINEALIASRLLPVVDIPSGTAN